MSGGSSLASAAQWTCPAPASPSSEPHPASPSLKPHCLPHPQPPMAPTALSPASWMALVVKQVQPDLDSSVHLWSSVHLSLHWTSKTDSSLPPWASPPAEQLVLALALATLSPTLDSLQNAQTPDPEVTEDVVLGLSRWLRAPAHHLPSLSLLGHFSPPVHPSAWFPTLHVHHRLAGHQASWSFAELRQSGLETWPTSGQTP